MDKSRRDFLKICGIVGVGLGVTTAAEALRCNTSTDSAQETDGDDTPDVSFVSEPPEAYPDSDTVSPEVTPTIEIQQEGNPLDPRMSPVLRERFEHMQEELCEPHLFHAHRVIANAEAMRWQGAALVDSVQQTFRRELALRRQFAACSPELLDWMTDLCVLGQVTTESGWNIRAQGAGSDTGLWQMTDISLRQINTELQQPSDTPLDRTHPIESTRAITFFYDYLYRDLRINGKIDTFKSKYDVQDTEFLIPVMLTAYNTGCRPVINSLETFTADPQSTGLDIFIAFINHLAENNPNLAQHKLEYFLKCYALCQLHKEQREQQEEL